MTSFFGKIKGQEENRRYEEFADKHGRLYGANVEITTGDPCEVLKPCGWTAPLLPWAKGFLIPPEDPQILKMVPRRERARRGYSIEIDYKVWLEKWDASMERWQKRLRDYALAMTKGQSQVTAFELMQNPTNELLVEVGPKPFPPREFIVAAAAGNRWALGLAEEIPLKARPILDAIAPAFALRARRPVSDNFEDPFAEDGAEYVDDDEDELEPDLKLADPLSEEVEDLEDQFDPEATGGKRVPVGAGAGKSKPPTTKKKR